MKKQKTKLNGDIEKEKNKSGEPQYKKRDDMGNRDIPVFIAFILAVPLLVAYIFYDDLWGIIPGIVPTFYCWKTYIRHKNKKRAKEKRGEFRDFITAVESAVRSGESLKSALISAGDDMKKLHGKDKNFMKELLFIKRMLELGNSPATVLKTFGERNEIREAKRLAKVIDIAELTGGSTIKVMENAIEKIGTEAELEEEISVLIAEKNLELKLMILMPSVMVAYLKLTNPEYIAALYGNLMGIGLMSAVILLSIGSDILGKRIIEAVDVKGG